MMKTIVSRWLARVLASLSLLLAVPGPGWTQDKLDPTLELLRRTYAVVEIDNGWLAAGTTYGVVLYHVPESVVFPEDGSGVVLADRRKGMLLPDSVNDLLYHEGVLFSAIGPHGVVGMTIQPDGSMERVCEISTSGAAMGLAAFGSLLFVAEGVMGVSYWDVSERSSPVRAAALETDGYVRDVLVVECARDSLRSNGVDNSSATATRTGTDRPRQFGSDCAGSGSGTLPGEAGERSGQTRASSCLEVFAAAGRAGVVKFHLDTSSKPSSFARLATAQEVRALALLGKGIVFSQGAKGVCVADRTLTEATMQCIDIGGDTIRDVMTLGTTVYLAAGPDGLVVVDWSRRAEPKIVKRCEVSAGEVIGLAVWKDYLVTATDYGGVVVLPTPLR